MAPKAKASPKAKAKAKASPKTKAKAEKNARKAPEKAERRAEPEDEAPAAGPRRESKAAAPAPRPPAKPPRVKVPFPKKNQPPSEAEFLARMALPVGKKFEAVRSFLKKQKGVSEDLYYYGPKTGWAYRYLRGTQSLATLMIHAERLVGIVALDAAALAAVDFSSLSEVGEMARRLAHGSPSLSWLDLPLDGAGASDFKVLLKAKLKALPVPGARPATPPPPPPPRPASSAPSARRGEG